MHRFTKETALKILTSEISTDELLREYPAYQNEVLRDIKALKQRHGSGFVTAMRKKYTADSQLAAKKIKASDFSRKTVDTFLPMVIKSRLALYLLEQFHAAVSKDSKKVTRLSLWDGMILQKLLFTKGFDRKLVKIGRFRFFWRLVRDKGIVMPLLNSKGMYCFYSEELIDHLAGFIGGRTCIEIAAGDGALTRFLRDKGVGCIATDDGGRKANCPEFVEQIDVNTALGRYRPEVVICSWPMPGNTFEKHVFAASSVIIYIVIGSKTPLNSCDFEGYRMAGHFSMRPDETLSKLVIPPSEDNAVYIFERKGTAPDGES